jgi:DNA mismatch endonuclease, patch repair protein
VETLLRMTLPGGGFAGVRADRSAAMAAVKGRNNRSTEWRLRGALVAAGISGWYVRRRDVVGAPDFVFVDARLVIFVDGCYWHGCPRCGHYPATRASFWRAKLDGNRRRDRRNNRRLRRAGFAVLRYWEHELREDIRGCVAHLRAALRRRRAMRDPLRESASRDHRPSMFV